MKASKLMDVWIENTTAAVEPARELNKIAKSAVTKLTEQQMAAAKEFLKFGTQGVKTLGSIREPRALINQQVELTKELSSKVLDNTKAYTKLVANLQGDLASWAEKTTGAVIAKTEAVVSKAA